MLETTLELKLWEQGNKVVAWLSHGCHKLVRLVQGHDKLVKVSMLYYHVWYVINCFASMPDYSYMTTSEVQKRTTVYSEEWT